MKVLITPRSYGKEDPDVFRLLDEAGLEVVRNDTDGVLSKAQMMEAIVGCEGVIVGIDPLDADVMRAAPRLRAIAKYGVGTDNIDLAEAQKRGVRVSKTTGANAEAVADYAMALIMAVTRKVVLIDRSCRRGDWRKIMTRDVSRAALGILGFGAIGRLLAKRAAGFDMKVLAYDPVWNENAAAALGVTRADPETIYRTCDILSLHLPLNDETRGCIGRDQLARMKPGAILINTARGGLIDEAALLEALRQGRIGGAGIDAFTEEPPSEKEWYTLENVVIGSHCAASTAGAARNMGRMATESLIRDLRVISAVSLRLGETD